MEGSRVITNSGLADRGENVFRLFIACLEEAKKKRGQAGWYYPRIADLRNHKIKHKGIEGIR